MTRLRHAFGAAAAAGDGALVGYVMGGDPDARRGLAYARALARGGVDVLELGIPFSDPMADGPTIQRAGLRARAAGATPRAVLDQVRDLRPEFPSLPIVLMTYANVLFARGWDRFAAAARAAGADGFVVPDLPADEAGDLRAACAQRRLDLVPLAAPTTSDARLRRLLADATGFLYLVSRYGVTGADGGEVGGRRALVQRVSRACAAAGVPLAVGFGLSRPEHVRAVLRDGADGAVVGSAFVARVEAGEAPADVERAVRALKEATRGAAAARLRTRRTGTSRPARRR